MQVIDNNGKIYESINAFIRHYKLGRGFVQSQFKTNGFYENQSRGIKAWKYEPKEEVKADIDQEYENYKATRFAEFNYYKIDAKTHKEGERYAIALFSDAHIEETVDTSNVLGLNEYDTTIAEQRIKAYFANLATCLKRDKVNCLYFSALGDTLSGFIHEHLMQENGMTPPEATLFGQSLIVSGLRFLREQLPDLKIVFIGICGNHSRTTKKLQNSNGFKLSYEWIMYQNIKQICEMLNLDIEFIIPESEVALVQTPDNKRYIFCHGFQVQSKGTGTVAGIYPALQRLAMKWQKVFKQDKIFLGHYHTCVSIPTATVNGSIIGYNAFALTNGMGYEEPAQMYEVFDSEIGQLLSRKIYCK